MENTSYWEKRFKTFNNTAEERIELIHKAYNGVSDYSTQLAYCETAERYGYFNNVDFVLDMMNIGGSYLYKDELGDFLCNFGLLGDIDFVFEHIFDFIKSSKDVNLVLYMIQAFGLKKCIEKDPEKFLKLLEKDLKNNGDLFVCFIEEPEAFFANIPENLKGKYAELFEKYRKKCNSSLYFNTTEAEEKSWKKFWATKKVS